MAAKFNFTTKLGLDAKEFKAGVNSVRSSVNGLKSSFLSLASALGAGLGFTQLISNLKTTATDLSVAMNTLKNVSYQTKAFKDGTKETTIEVTNFKDNLSFVRKLADDYAQDLIAVTDNYAKFTAACKKTSLTLDDQRFVFESLTKAAAYYHLSADRTTDMMNAVTQMMSKGKVAAEELRRQLGNTLPGAFNMMAAAMGVTTSELDKLMRDGKVIAADVLPRFAAMLNAVTSTAEFDSLQSSMNKFKNAWYSLVEKSGAENMFKGIIDGSTNALNFTTRNIKGIKSTFVGLITYLMGSNISSVWKTNTDRWLKDLDNGLKDAENLTKKYSDRIKMFISQGALIKNQGEVTTFGINEGVLDDHSIFQARKHLENYHNQLLEVARRKLELGRISKETFETIREEVQNANSNLSPMVTVLDDGTKGMNRFQVATNKAATSLKNFFKANWVMLLLSALSAALSYIIKIRNEAKEIANIANEYTNDIKKQQGTIDEQASILRNNLKIVKNTKNSESERLLALKEINKTLGLTGKYAYDLKTLDTVKGKYDEITKSVLRWIEATKTQALIQGHANAIADATAKKTMAEVRKKIIERKLAEKGALGNNLWMGIGVHRQRKEVEDITKEIEQYDTAITDSQQNMENLGVELGKFFDVLNENGSSSSEDALEDLMDKYAKDKKNLENQLKEHAITEEEFNKEFDKLVSEYWKKSAALGELSIDDIINKMDKGSTLSKLENWYYTLAKDAATAAKNALIKNFSDEVIKEVEKEIDESLAAFDKKLEDKFDKETKKLHLDIDVSDGKFDPKKRKERNSLLDYSKKGSDVISEELANTQDWYKDVKKNYEELIEKSKGLGDKTEDVKEKLEELAKTYKYAAQEAETLEAAMNYSKIVEDIKNIQNEIDNLVYSGVKDFATSIDRVVSATENLKETMKDSDASAWEKFMAIFNMITQIIDSAISVYETFNKIEQLNVQLGAAKIAEQTALNALLKEELALRMAAQGASDEEIAKRVAGLQSLFAEEGLLSAILGLKKQEGAQTATNTALKTGEAAATAASASASAGEAVAGATASGSKMPFPYNLIAIAAGVAAVVGALASMKKFATGGIVGGNSTHGDRNMVRVNSGEMILNKAQQGTLWSMLNGKGGMGGNVEFKIKGADLVGTINNYGSRKRG